MPFSALLKERGKSFSFKEPEEIIHPYFYATEWNMSIEKLGFIALDAELP